MVCACIGRASVASEFRSYCPATKPLRGGQAIFSTKETAMSATPIPVPELQLETVKTPEEIFVRCIGRITSITTGTFQTEVRSCIPETKRVVLDLTDVSYMDSSGLGAIVGLYLSARRQQRELKLINLNQRLKELFRITNLAKVFEGHEEMLGITPD
jgi:anti-sigma B factor antagonist